MGRLEELRVELEGKIELVYIYINEAHPSDEWQMAANEERGIVFAQPRTDAERMVRARAFVSDLEVEGLTLVDDIRSADQTLTVVEGLGLNQPPSVFRLAQPADSSIFSATEAPIIFSWEAPVDAEGDALSYTVYLAGPGFERTVEGLTEPRLSADSLPSGETLTWTVTATDGHSVRGSLDRFRLVRSLPTAVEDEPPVAPFSISQYPNPFRTTTTLRFTVAQASSVDVRIYDVTGRLVRTLIDRRLSRGEHVQVWDGLDDRGTSVAPGVYVVRIEAGTSAQSRVLVRI